MKVSRVTKISTILLLFLFAVALIVSKPIYAKLEQSVSKYTDMAKDYLYEKTGLNLSYESFSPSILSYFYIKEITLTDEQNDVVLKINKTKINYSISALLKKDYTRFFRSVSVSGVEVELSKIEILAKKLSKDDENKEWKGVDTQIIEQIYSFIPISIYVDDVVLIYDNEDVNVNIAIKDFQSTNSRRNKNLNVQFDSNEKIFVKKQNINVTGSAFVTGVITSNLEKSSVYVKVTDFTEGTYKLKKMNFLGTYENNSVEAHTIQSTVPFYASCNFDILNKIFTAECNSDNLYPNSLYTTTNKEVWDILEPFKVSVRGDLTYEVDSEFLNYNSSGKVYVPEKFFPGTAVVSYDVSGDRENINLKSAAVNGPSCTANLSLLYNIENFWADGNIDVEKYVLPNNKVVSAQIYVDHLKKGFMVFSPQVNIGSKALTALQCKIMPLQDSIDFEVEASDYSNGQDSTPGMIKLNGSYLLESKYAQTSLSLNTLSISSVLEYGMQLVDSELAQSLQSVVNFSRPYVFTGDTYFSSDFKSLSFNVPYVVVANTEKDNQYAFITVNGNEQSIQLNRFDLILGNFALNLTGGLDINPDTKDMFYSLDLIASSIPYHFTGSIMKEIITLQGDYGVEGQVRFLKNGKFDGYALMQNLPVVYDKISLILSLDSKFTYSNENGPEITLNKLQVEENNISSTVNPKLILAGIGTKYGAQINTINYSDKYSSMDGFADLTININEETFDSAGFKFNLKNSSSEERITMDIVVSNPDKVALNSDTVFNNLYINSQIDINHFGLNRFTNVKNNNNELTSSIFLTGTLEHPYAALTVQNFTCLLGTNLIKANCSALLEDRNFIINELNVKYPSWQITKVSGSGNIEKAEAKITGTFETLTSEYNLEVPLTLSVHDSFYNDESFLPESFTVTLNADSIGGSLIKKNAQFEISAIYNKDVISIFSSDNIGLVGTYLPQSGEVFGSLNSENVINFEIGGTVKSNKMDLNISNIQANLKNICSYLNIDKFLKVENGTINGFVQIGGNPDTPDFFVNLKADKPSFYMPFAFQNILSTDSIEIIALHNEFTLREKNYSIKNVPKFKFGGKIILDKWTPDSISLSLATLKNAVLPLKFDMAPFKVKGDIISDIKLNYSDNIWDVSGKMFGDKFNVEIDSSNLVKKVTSSNNSDSVEKEKSNDLSVRTDLNITLGTHASFNFKPILQCIFVPGTVLHLKMDTDAQIYDVDGELSLKSGDLAYLNRSFYIRQGKLKFNPTDITNPYVTLKAETREKDDNGENVKIILSVENQALSDLDPKFSSEPAKSELEIMTLLGKIAIADTEKFTDVLGTVGDTWIQSTVIRDLENKLRDLMNFDIFSIRTNIVQNTINLSSSGQLNGNNKITIGNFLDNTTVYMGKYLGNNLYVDSMFHFSLQDGNVNDVSAAKGLLFQPEFGMELELPIVNIRWNMAPNIEALMNGEYVPSNSLTLSWKFVF